MAATVARLGVAGCVRQVPVTKPALQSVGYTLVTPLRSRRVMLLASGRIHWPTGTRHGVFVQCPGELVNTGKYVPRPDVGRFL
jgi:hypothetical protein